MVSELTVSELIGLVFGAALVAGLVSTFMWDALRSLSSAIGRAIPRRKEE